MSPASRLDAILVVTGLISEAKIAAGPGIVTIAGGADRDGLEARLAAFDLSRVAAIVSFGLAGALDPSLPVGAVICPDLVSGPGGVSAKTDRQMTAGQRTRLAAAGALAGPILGVDAPVMSRGAKAALHASSGAVAVDMESHVAAAFAARVGLPFSVVRVISDAAGRELPPIAGRAMRPDGSVDVVGVLAGLVRAPGQLPGLLATARDAAVAFRALRRVRGLLGPRLGLHL